MRLMRQVWGLGRVFRGETYLWPADVLLPRSSAPERSRDL